MVRQWMVLVAVFAQLGVAHAAKKEGRKIATADVGCEGPSLSIIDSAVPPTVEVIDTKSKTSLVKFEKSDISSQGITKDGVRYQIFMDEHGYFFLLFRGSGVDDGNTVFQALYRHSGKFISDSMKCD
jgi:hypothetical protein